MQTDRPQLPKGMPSYDAIKAHTGSGGLWIGTFGELGRGGSILFVSFDVDGDEMAVWDDEHEWHNYEHSTDLATALSDWRFWPCNDTGDKVPWPIDRNGNML